MPSSFKILNVERVLQAASDVIVVHLVDANGDDLERWGPGAHIDLCLPSGAVRQYSLCGDTSDLKRYRVGILRDPEGRGGSIEAHDRLVPGIGVRIGSPRNHFALKNDSAYVFVAGGIGITPLLPMMSAVEQAGKPWELIYGGRSRKSMAFLDEVTERSFGCVRIQPQDELGLIDLGSVIDRLEPGTAVYSCGPSAMLDALEALAGKAGKRDQVHIERFAAPRALHEPAPDDRSGAFSLELAKTGIMLQVSAGQSIKSALEEAGVYVPFSCEEGYCGSCETQVLAGVPEHHDILLTAEERAQNKSMMVCVGRCASATLVLDL